MTARADIDSALPGAPVPAHLRVYVDVLGTDLTVELLLKLGGGVTYFAESPQARSPIAAVVGLEKARELAKALGPGALRIPTGKPFIAKYYRDKGWKVVAIARLLHVTDSTVRNMLRVPDDRQQLQLF